MKISRKKFADALSAAMEGKDNYQCNIDHNAGRWNYHYIHRVVIDGVPFYCSPCCKTANSDISVIRRVCGRC